MSNYNRWLCLILALAGFFLHATAQYEYYKPFSDKIITINGTLTSDEGCLLHYTPIASASIEIFVNNERHDSIVTDTNGIFTYSFQAEYIQGKTIKLRITKGPCVPMEQKIKIPEGRRSIDLAIQMPLITEMYLPFIMDCFMPNDVPWYLKDAHHVRLDAARNLVWDNSTTSYDNPIQVKP